MNKESAEISDERYRELMSRSGAALSPQERAAGWHYCPEWGWLLVLPKGRCRCGLSFVETEAE